MSLTEKLSQMSEELEKQKQEKIFTPIREKIEGLEHIKEHLEYILDNLNFSPEDEESFGMRSYPMKVADDKTKSTEYLNSLIRENKEVLSPLGVDSIAKLIENPIAEGTPEVSEYSRTNEAEADLKDADQSLFSKLIEYGVINENDNSISTNDGFVSYEKAAQKIKRRLETLEEEILLEKIKTPEGGEAKEKIVSKISKEIENDVPSLTFSSSPNRDGYEELAISNNNSKILIKDDLFKWNGWVGEEVKPSIIGSYEVKYGSQATKEALEKAYSTKIDTAFERLDKNNRNNDALLQTTLERSSPEKWVEANKSYEDYVELTKDIKSLLHSKSEELSLKGINFNPENIRGYGAGFDTFFALTEYDSDYKKIIESFQFGGTLYPPQLYYDSLKEYIDKKIEKVTELTELIKNINSEEDISNLARGGYHSELSEMHRKILSVSFDGVRAEKRDDFNKLEAFRSYHEAHNHFEEINSKRAEKKRKILEKIELAIEMRRVKDELQAEMKAAGIFGDVSRLDTEMQTIERNKKDAENLLGELISLEMDVPDETLILSNNQITVPSVSKKIEELKEKLIGMDRDINILRSTILEKASKKPLVFGIKAWETSLTDMKGEEKKLSAEISNGRTNEMNNLYNKLTYYIRTPQYSDLEKLLKSQNRVELKKDEIFSIIRTTVSQMADKKLPENILRLNDEYKELQGKLY